ncbi:MAG: type VII secretion protein EssC [Anaerolineales bacterium]
MTRRQIQLRRGQRGTPALPTEEVVVPNYPAEPTAPTKVSWWLVVAPVGGIMLMSFGFGILYKNLLYPILISTVSLVYPMVMLLRQREQRHRWEQERDRVRQAYQARMSDVEKQLERQRAQQRESLQWVFPAPEKLVIWGEQVSERLWERRSGDSDFLDLRVGVGEAAASFTVKVPAVEIPDLAPKQLLEARDLAVSYRRVGQVPLSFSLREGSLGISGPRRLREAAAAALIGSAAALHAPQDLVLYAILPTRGISEWGWLKWLPHTQVLYPSSARVTLAFEQDRIALLLAGLLDELEARAIQATASSDGTNRGMPFLLVLVADSLAVQGETAMQRLLSDGPSLQAGAILLTSTPRDLPHGCRGRIEIKNDKEASYSPHAGAPAVQLAPDLMTAANAEKLARGLAPVELTDAQLSSALPDQIRLMELLGSPDLARIELKGRWLAALGRPPTLKVPIGMRHGNRPLILDLRQSGHGPHGLIAGTTGSGKSELLLSLLTSLALSNHPHQVSLVLVDYKGGTAMSVLGDLPHTVGVVTDLDGKQTRRALVALRSELTRREEILARHQVADIDKYHELGISEPFSYIFIVIDEFAELKERFKYDLGEILNEFVSVAQKGRALGVHLILAMQRPEGVVNDSIRANMRYRICLRVERAEDSRNVLGRPDAYLLPSHPPGRAYFQVGKDEQFDLFQVARVAGFYRGEDRAAGIDEPLIIQEVAPDGRRFPLSKVEVPLDHNLKSEAIARTDAQILVEMARKAADQMGIRRLPSPWPGPLPTEIPLEELFESAGQPAWDGLAWPSEVSEHSAQRGAPVGLLDEPAKQRQVPLSIDFDRDGNLLVVGSPGSGRTTSLLTLVASLARTQRPDLIHFHLIDFGGHQLRAAFSNFPHVAGVYGPETTDRIQRLLSALHSELESRRARFEKAGVVGLEGYRMLRKEHDQLPAILTVINNLSGFQEAFPDELGGWIRLFREGGAYGLYFALSSDRMPSGKVADLIPLRIALRLAERTMYSLILDSRPDLTLFDPVPGRGFLSSKPPLEVQIALPARGSVEGQIQALQDIGARMDEMWDGSRPKPIQILEDQTSLAAVLQAGVRLADQAKIDSLTWIGLDDSNLRPVEFDLAKLGSYFLICGPPESGKTTALATLALALAAIHGPGEIQFGLITPNRNERYRLDSLAKLPHALGQAKTEATIAPLLSRLAEEAAARLAHDIELGPSHSHILVLIDDFHLLSGRVSEGLMHGLAELAKKGADTKMTIVMTLPSTVLGSLSDPLIRQARAWRSGIWLQSTDSLESSLVGLRIPQQLRGKQLPQGRGFLFDPGGQVLTQLGSPEIGAKGDPHSPASLASWVQHILAREVG